MSLEILFAKYQKISKLQNYSYKRYFYKEIDFNDKMIGIIGARGTGKTTSTLQYLENLSIPFDKKLYISADSIILGNMTLYEIADTFSKSGGKVLVIDEIHKYKNYEIELKEIYDFLDLQIVFSGSSAIQLEHKKADLSRRAVLHRIQGLSFREFLELKLSKNFRNYELLEILTNHIAIANELNKELKPFEYFKEYLSFGYYPYYFENKNSYSIKLEETINAVIEMDLPIVFNIEPQNIQKLKQLTALICSSKPYELNITELSSRIGINRTTLYSYIEYLTLGNVFYSLKATSKNDTVFSKPNKLYLNNTNLSANYCNQNDIGMTRELFFAMSLRTKHKLHYPTKGDFLVDNKYIFEIGGKNKDFTQIKDIPNSYVVADDIEIGFGNKIPLWLFGFLY